MRDSLVLYTAYCEKFKKLNDEQFGQLVRAMLLYQKTGVAPDIEDYIVALSFDVAKVEVDINNAKYDEIIQKRREAGAKGGLAKASKAKQELAKASKNKQTLAKQARCSINDNDNDNENDNVNENVINIKSAQKRFSADDRLNESIKDFIEHRKKLRKPMSDKAVELFINRLNKMASTPEQQIELINLAILKGWQTVYPNNEKAEQFEPRKNDDKLQALEDFFLNGGNK